MKGIIIYNTKYGSTRQYAEWLSDELSFPVNRNKDIVPGSLFPYEVVIVGSPVYMGKLRLRKWLADNSAELQRKKVFLFIVYGNAGDEEESRSLVVDDNLPGELRANTEVFFLPGRVIHSRLGFFDKVAVRMGARMQPDPEKKRQMMADMDEVKKINLNPLISAISELSELTSKTATPHH